MNGDVVSESPRRALWERLGFARGVCARLCRRRGRTRVAPMHNGNNSNRSRESRRRINHPPSALYSVVGEKLRVSTPRGLQCALFCGGQRCRYELPQPGTAIQGLYSDWVTDDILAMARPSTANIAARNIIQQFHSWGIRTVINLQTPGEHASCGPPLTKSGFTYDPTIFMANDMYYYNFAWPDYAEASLSGLLNMAKVLSFALQEGRVAIHCHAGVCKSNVRLDGKIALVTGGNQGIGLETARDLASRGAQVIIASRDAIKAAEAINDIAATTGNKQVEFKPLDLSKLSSVRKFAEEFNKSYDRLDILVNNAGCGGLNPKLTEDRIDVVMQINYFGPFLLTNLLLDKLIASEPSRIIIVSSVAHKLARICVDDLHQSSGEGAWGMFINYANSKLCDLLWTKALAKRLPEGVTANCLHPGVIKTDIFRRVPAVVKKIMNFVFDIFFRGPKGGAQTTIHLCVSEEVENVRGRYFMECKEGEYSSMADDDELVEQVWNKSLKVTSTSLGRTGVLIACYLVYSLRIRANDAIRLVRKKRPRSVQTSGQILCVQQFEHYMLPQTIVFSSKETLNLTKDRKTSEFTLKQHLYRQRATLHGLEERAFRELPKIVYCLCERLLKLCGCHQSVGLDFRVKNKPFYKSFMVYKLRKSKPPDPTTPDEAATELDNIAPLPMVEWRDPVEEDIERNLESVSKITGTANNGSIPAVQVYEAFTVDHHSLPEERQKYLKTLRNEINQQREAYNKINVENDPTILTGLLFEWLEGLKQPVLDREDLSLIVGRAYNVESCVMALTMEDIMLLEYLLRFVTRLRPLAANKKVDILKRLLASLTHQTVSVNGRCLPTRKDFQRLRDGTSSQVVNFMLRMIVELQKDMMKPGRDDADVVVPQRRFRIKAWK